MCFCFRQVSSNFLSIFFVFSYWNIRRFAADPYTEIQRRCNVRNKVYFSLSKDCMITIPDAIPIYNTECCTSFWTQKNPPAPILPMRTGFLYHKRNIVLCISPNLHSSPTRRGQPCFNRSESRSRPPSPPASLPTGRRACRRRCRPSSRPRRRCKYPPCPY